MKQDNKRTVEAVVEGEKDGEWRKKFMDLSDEISLERKVLLNETGKLHDACVLSGIMEDFGQNDNNSKNMDVAKATSNDGSVYANYIVQTRLDKVKRHICITKEHIKLKNDEIKELKEKIKELEKVSFPVDDKPVRLPKQKPLPPVRKISRDVQREFTQGTNTSTEEEATTSPFLRPRAATYSNGSSLTTQDDTTKLSLPKSPRSDPNLSSQEKLPLFHPLKSPRMRRRSGLSMIQGASSTDKVLSSVNLKDVHFNLPGGGSGGCHAGKTDSLSPRRKFSHPTKLETFPFEKV